MQGPTVLSHLTSRLWVTPSPGAHGRRPLVPAVRCPHTNRCPLSADVGPVVFQALLRQLLKRVASCNLLDGAPGISREASSAWRALPQTLGPRTWAARATHRRPAHLGFLPPRAASPGRLPTPSHFPGERPMGTEAGSPRFQGPARFLVQDRLRPTRGPGCKELE